MYLILTASKDAYITNKIIGSKFRATDANTGRAGTIDLFKLYNESKIDDEVNPVEYSRGLVKIDLSALQQLTASVLDVNNFKCFLSLKSIDTGHHTPSNFSLDVYPVAQEWDEGIGRDVSAFSDLDTVNFITASYRNGTLYAWNEDGADKKGFLGSGDIDLIASGDLGKGDENLFVTQEFIDGSEDLYVDITKIVSATLVDLLPNYGFRLSFSESEEQDQKTRFVKRFYSRHSNNVLRQPTVRVMFDDSLRDDTASFYFNTTGTLLMSNNIRGKNQFLLSGSGLTEISGENCLVLRITTGSVFEKIVLGSTIVKSTSGEAIPGLYEASFCIPYTDTSLVISGTQNFSVYDIASVSGSIRFKTEWCSLDQNIVFSTGSLVVSKPKISSYNSINQNPSIKIVNLKQKYKSTEKTRIRLFGINLDNRVHTPVKLPVYEKSEFFEDVFYSVRDALTHETVIPFERSLNGTRVSRDSEGMYFDLLMSTLFPGKNYNFEFLIISDGSEHVHTNANISFRVEK